MSDEVIDKAISLIKETSDFRERVVDFIGAIVTTSCIYSSILSSTPKGILKTSYFEVDGYSVKIEYFTYERFTHYEETIRADVYCYSLFKNEEYTTKFFGCKRIMITPLMKQYIYGIPKEETIYLVVGDTFKDAFFKPELIYDIKGFLDNIKAIIDEYDIMISI